MNMQQIETARQLLPWYITGKLSSSEMKLVKEAIASYPVLRDEYKTQSKLSQMIKKDPQLIEISVISTQEQRMGALMQRIRTEKTVVTKPMVSPQSQSSFFFMPKLENFKSFFTGFSGLFSKPWGFATVASIVFIQVAVLSFYLSRDSADPTEYELVTDKDKTSSLAVAGQGMIVTFDPNSMEQERQQVLRTIDNVTGMNGIDNEGNIKGAEGRIGSYQLMFSKPMTEEQITALILKIQAHQIVQFAGRS